MNFLNYRKLLTEANRNTRFIRKNSIPIKDITNKSVNGIQILENTSPMGITPSFSQNPFNIVHFELFDSTDDEPTRIRALKIKSKYQDLTNDETAYLQRFYSSSEKQQDKDNRIVLGEGYKLTKRALGINTRSYN